MSRPDIETPAPLSASKTDNWVARAGGLPHPVQHVARALIAAGHPESEAIAIAVGKMHEWAKGGSHVHPDTAAVYQGAEKDWDAKRVAARKETGFMYEGEPTVPEGMHLHEYRVERRPGHNNFREMAEHAWDELKHPRGVHGRWTEVMYHVAPAHAREDIREHGLRPDPAHPAQLFASEHHAIKEAKTGNRDVWAVDVGGHKLPGVEHHVQGIAFMNISHDTAFRHGIPEHRVRLHRPAVQKAGWTSARGTVHGHTPAVGAGTGAGWEEGKHPRGFHGKFMFSAAGHSAADAAAVLATHPSLRPGVRVGIISARGASASHSHGVIQHNHGQSGGAHNVTVRMSNGTTKKMSLHPHNPRNGNRIRPSGFVNRQAIGQWWRNAGRVHKDGMTAVADSGAGSGTMTTERDFDHQGQAPTTIQQGSSKRMCPRCGRTAVGGVCPVHGTVRKYERAANYVRDESPAPPSPTGEDPKITSEPERKRNPKAPAANEPAGPTHCRECGGQDGYHNPMCIHVLVNPGSVPDGAGTH